MRDTRTSSRAARSISPSSLREGRRYRKNSKLDSSTSRCLVGQPQKSLQAVSSCW
ncbi:MAG: hypothetical protein MZV64_50515 [Ignavibacteriales bacterium]|nr:hypothetical protein [Ignavibacteriales bacterium]